MVGRAEDVSDIITNLSPTKTPFSSSLKSEKVSQRNFDWQEDSLRAVQTNAKVEGFTASDATLSATTLRSNYTQILEKTIKVSATSDVIQKYGRAKETAYQLSKAGEELNRDLENAMVGMDQAAVAGDNSSTARQMASAIYQISATTTITTDSDTGTVGNQAGPLTEANVLTLHQTLYNQGSDPSILMVKPADSQLIAAFTGASGRYREVGADSQKLVNSVNIYVSPFGELKVVINRFVKTDHAIMYDPDMWRKITLRPWTRTTLAKNGDNEMNMLVGEFSLKHMNQLASGKIKNLT
jgi:hypothetical protein